MYLGRAPRGVQKNITKGKLEICFYIQKIFFCGDSSMFAHCWFTATTNNGFVDTGHCMHIQVAWHTIASWLAASHDSILHPCLHVQYSSYFTINLSAASKRPASVDVPRASQYRGFNAHTLTVSVQFGWTPIQFGRCELYTMPVAHDGHNIILRTFLLLFDTTATVSQKQTQKPPPQAQQQCDKGLVTPVAHASCVR